jgi:hypothetical protein
MRKARTPADTYTLSQSLSSTSFSDSSFRASYSSPAFSPPPPPLNCSHIKPPYPTQSSSHFASSRPISQPFSSQPLLSPQPTRHPLPPRSSSPTHTPFPNFNHTAYPPTSRPKVETTAKSDETPKDELVALLSRTSQAIASKSTEMENIRKQLQATEQRLRVLQSDKEEMDAQRTVLRDGIDAFGKSIGHV